MNKADLERFRSSLLGLRTRLTGDVSHLHDEAIKARGGANQPARADVADVGADSYEYEFTLSLIENQEQTITEIDEALERIRKGKYGRCEECGDAIPRPRLQALPYARHCVTCARKLQ
jgi:DnaK suppressor protein